MAVTELWGSRKVSYANTGSTGIRKFESAWADQLTDKNALLNAVFPGHVVMKCKSVDVEPLGDIADGGGYENALLTAHYSSETSGIVVTLGVDTMSETWEIGGEALSTGGALFFWTTDDGDSKRKQVPESTLTLTSPLASIAYAGAFNALPKANIIAAIGKVNDTTWYGFLSDTLLFEGVHANRSWGDAVDDYIWNIAYKFVFKPSGWNNIWNPFKTGGPGWDTVTVSSSGGSVYDIYSDTSFGTLISGPAE